MLSGAGALLGMFSGAIVVVAMLYSPILPKFRCIERGVPKRSGKSGVDALVGISAQLACLPPRASVPQLRSLRHCQIFWAHPLML